MTTFASFTLTVQVLEDLHAGSGLGGADIDALVARDRLGRPVVRWSHLRGLLKQALVDRGQVLGEDTSRLQLELFGRSHLEGGDGHARGALQGRSLRLSKALGGQPERSIVWGSTARQPGSRVPQTDTLRRVEFVPAGTEFQGELRVPDTLANQVAKLLLRINRMGGDRSRGAGLVCLKAEKRTIKPPALHPDPKVAAAQAPGHRLLFKALDPVALGATGSPGNLIRGHSHLSPGAVHGMLVRWALAVKAHALADALLDRRIVCGPAYPVPADDVSLGVEQVESLPFPLSFQAPKPPGQASPWPWWAAGAEPDTWQDTLPDKRKAEAEHQREKLKRPGAHDYLVRTGQRWQRFRCEPGEAMRNNAGTSQRAAQPQPQQLFSQEEIAEDTGFVTRIEARDAQAEALLQPALAALATAQHWLTAGRGGAPLVLVGHCDAGTHTVQPPAGEDQPDTVVRVLVESDLILRAPDMRFRTRLDEDAVLHLLKLAGADDAWLARLSKDRKAFSVEEVSESAEVRGRNVASAGPRLPALAIRRGSEAELVFSTPEDASTGRHLLGAACAKGLGERTAEGHGRLRLDFAPACSTGPSASQTTIVERPSEGLLARATEWLEHQGFPAAFTARRWQGLRNAVRAGGTAAMKEWLQQARREARRLSQRGARGPADGGAGWIDQIEARLWANAKGPLLRTIAVLAAKRKREREDESESEG